MQYSLQVDTILMKPHTMYPNTLALLCGIGRAFRVELVLSQIGCGLRSVFEGHFGDLLKNSFDETRTQCTHIYWYYYEKHPFNERTNFVFIQ